MRKVKVSAPGKLVLLGEHAVVWGRPCLVMAVDRRLEISIEKLEEKFLEIEAPSVGIRGYRKDLNELGKNNPPKKARFVEMEVKNFAEKYGLNFGVKIKTEDGPPLNFGLGSSAAITVAVLRGLIELSRKNLTQKELFDLAYKTVLDVQGVGSGFDVAAAIYGGTLYFKTGGEKIEKLTDFNLPLAIGWSGVKADTPTLVRKIAKEKEKHPQIIEEIFEKIEGLVEEGKKALFKRDWQALGELMNVNQKLLENLGVNTPKLAKLIYASCQAGALGAKLSGAGGGDCMIALVDEEDKKDVEEAIKNAGGKVIKARTGAEGVRVEDTAGVDNPSEIFVVVDKNDKVLGFEERSKCHQDKSLIHRAIGVVIFNSQGKILLQKRSRNKDVFPGFYTISCSGHVGKGEEYLKSAERELKEELGVRIPLDFCKKFISRSERETEMNALFMGESEGPFFPNKDEIERVGFFSKKEIQDLSSQGKLLLTPFAKRSLQEMGVLEK